MHFFHPAELVDVGQAEEANLALYEIITDNQTRRRQWSKTYEGIMMRLMELSVQLRKPAMVKEALHKYRAMCMQSNVASLDDVVRALVAISEKNTEAARKSVSEQIIEGADDLEEGAMETPETLILEAAGNALTRERVDRQHVVPWMRFLWEVYRVVLDIVKTHNKLETCYHEMATRAFAFCVKYKRYMEFRRLCDMLRQHLNQLITYPRNSPNDVKITDNDTLQKFLETRFTQLSSAVTLEHWQEAYRTIEDIHMIISMGKTKTRPQHMSIYYDKIMQVFWVSGNYLYHAHALYKLYTLSVRQNRNLSEEDATTMASKLLLAALSIPVYDAQSAVLSDAYGAMTDVMGTSMSENAARHARMASLLGYTSAAERGTLITELLSKGVLKACHAELGDLYDLLEGKMSPLRFADRFKKIIAFVEGHEVLDVYGAPLRRVAIFRILEQLGRVYHVMRLEDVTKVVSFATYAEVEDTSLIALKTRSLAIRFDHQNQCVRFEAELFSTDGMREQLGRLAKRMAITSKMLTEKSMASAKTTSDREVVALARETEDKAMSRRLNAIAAAKAAAPMEEKQVLQRRELIERRKEEAERRLAEAVKQKKINLARELQRQNQKRKAEEALRRHNEAQQRLARGGDDPAAAGARPASGGVIGADEDDDAAREERMTREKEKELKQQAELKRKAQQYASHMNHVERALREAQWDMLKTKHEDESKALAKMMAEVSEKDLTDAKAHHTRALDEKERTKYIIPELKNYLDTLMKKVDADYDVWESEERARFEEQLQAEIAEEKAREEEERAEEERIENERIAAEREQEAAEKKAKTANLAARLQARKAAAVPGRPGAGGFGARAPAAEVPPGRPPLRVNPPKATAFPKPSDSQAGVAPRTRAEGAVGAGPAPGNTNAGAGRPGRPRFTNSKKNKTGSS